MNAMLTDKNPRDANIKRSSLFLLTLSAIIPAGILEKAQQRLKIKVKIPT